MLADDKIKYLSRKALEIRRSIVEMVYRAQSGHVGGSPRQGNWRSKVCRRG